MPTKRTEYQYKYDKDNTKQYRLKLNTTHDQDIIKHLDSMDNKQGYIKSLIRQDMQHKEQPHNPGTIGTGFYCTAKGDRPHDHGKGGTIYHACLLIAICSIYVPQRSDHTCQHSQILSANMCPRCLAFPNPAAQPVKRKLYTLFRIVYNSISVPKIQFFGHIPNKPFICKAFRVLTGIDKCKC